MKRIKSWFRVWVIKRMFTPIRAHKLEKASIRAEQTASSCSLHINQYGPEAGGYVGSSIYIHYVNDCDVFYYYRDNELALNEFMLIRDLVVGS